MCCIMAPYKTMIKLALVLLLIFFIWYTFLFTTIPLKYPEEEEGKNATKKVDGQVLGELVSGKYSIVAVGYVNQKPTLLLSVHSTFLVVGFIVGLFYCCSRRSKGHSIITTTTSAAANQNKGSGGGNQKLEIELKMVGTGGQIAPGKCCVSKV